MTLKELMSQRPAMRPTEVEIDGEKLMVNIKRLPSSEVLNLSAADDKKSSFKMVHASVLDDEGKPMFASVEEVAGKDWALVQPLLKAAMKVNGMDVDAAKKDSPANPS